MNKAMELIATERQRQIETEGWTPEHDDDHDLGELAGAAAAYALQAACELHPIGDALDVGYIPDGWCWDPQWWKPKGPVRDLVRAGALIVAELERLERAGMDITHENHDPVREPISDTDPASSEV